MTMIPAMVRAKPDGIPDMMAKSQAAQQPKRGGQSRQIRGLSLGWLERSVDDAGRQPPSPAAAEPRPAYDPKIHEAIDAIAAVLLGAETGLNWLGAEQPDVEKARKALNSIASDAKRTAEIVLRLQGA